MSSTERADPQSTAPLGAGDAAARPAPAAAVQAPSRASASQPSPSNAGPTLELVALAQLWADQFRHMATLSVAGFGGVLILTQSQLLELQSKLWVALGLCAASAIVAMQGQIGVVDGATAGRAPGRPARLMRGLAGICLGGAGGTVIAILIGR